MTKYYRSFKETLFLETNNYLSQKVGDILSAIENLHDDSNHLGSGQLVKASKGIVNQIRRIVKDDWPDTEINSLKTLQRVGVALAKAIDENGDLKDVLGSAVQELQQLTNKSGEPINDLGSMED